jgi:hypothetical protein
MDDRYLPYSTASSIVTQLPLTSQARKGRNRSHWIASRAQQVFGAYRKDEFANPEVFIMQIGTILERYSDIVVERVTSPVTGIQAKCKFPPAIAEIVEACDAEHRSHTYAAKYDQRTAKQLRERAEAEALERAEPLEYRRIVAERILKEYHAQCTPETRPQQQTWKRFTAEELLAMYSDHTQAPAA